MATIPPQVWEVAHTIVARNETNSTSTATTETRPGSYKAIGLSLAIASGLFIGTSFVLKKVGLLKSTQKYNEEAGEGYGYLKNWYWWTGMTLMIIGEIANFGAYCFVDAILVAPMGALSVVVTTILSAIFLKERLSFVRKVGCFNCIIGSIVIALNAPEQSAVADIQEMQHFVIAPGFLTYAGIIIAGCVFVALWVAPRYGKKSMLVYLSICSLIGGLSVVATQGLGSAIVAQANGESQFNKWFLYVLLVFVIATLLTEIIYLNVSTSPLETHLDTDPSKKKALDIFQAALVTPTYYVFFTSATIITSAVLFRGFKGTVVTIMTVVFGFFQICSGVILLQMSKSAKDVPDAAVFKGDLNQVREIAEVEQPETEPKADAIRGTAALIRRMSTTRRKWEQEEAKRLYDEKMQDQLEPVRENEVVEWDGLRRRKTVIGQPGSSPAPRRKTAHPPLGMSHFPEPDDEDKQDHGPNFFENLRSRAQTFINSPTPPNHPKTTPAGGLNSPLYPVALTDIRFQPSQIDSPIHPYGPGSLEDAQERIYGLAPGERKFQDTKAGIIHPSPRSKPLPAKPAPSPSLRPPQEARRQFSFTNFLRPGSRTPTTDQANSRPPMQSRTSSASHEQKRAMKSATEEERLGLVKGDSHIALLQPEMTHSPERPPISRPHSQTSSISSVDEHYRYQYPSPSQSSQSFSDDDDGWQMMNSTSPPRIIVPAPNLPNPVPVLQSPSNRKRPSPARNYQQQSATRNMPSNPAEQALPNTMLGGGQIQARVTPAASDRSQTSSTKQPPRSQSPPPGYEERDFAPHLARASDNQRRDESPIDGNSRGRRPANSGDEHDSGRVRFEEQSRREREERRLRATGRRQSWKPTTPE